MRKYIFLFFSALTVLCSCGDGTPDDIIDEKHMADLMVDIHIVNGSLVTIPTQPDSLYKYGTAKYLFVFKKHHTDSATFNRSFKYYTKNTKKLVAIYDEVTKKLQTKSDSLNKAFQKESSRVNVK
jgi:hypothetical protein